KRPLAWCQLDLRHLGSLARRILLAGKIRRTVCGPALYGPSCARPCAGRSPGSNYVPPRLGGLDLFPRRLAARCAADRGPHLHRPLWSALPGFLLCSDRSRTCFDLAINLRADSPTQEPFAALLFARECPAY